MEGTLFIQDLAVVGLVAAAAGWLCRQAGLSVVVGYLIAGIIVGPYTPPFEFVSDLGRIDVLAETGLVFLMFSIGLGSGLRRMRRLGLGALAATALGAILVLVATRLFGRALGYSSIETLFLAAMLMASSSAIIGKVLAEVGALHTPAGQRSMGVTVLEDFVAVVMLTVLASYANIGGESQTPLLEKMGLFVVFVIFVLILSLLFVPRLMRTLERSAEGELATLIIVGLVCLLALISVRAGYSLALGAFIIGVIIGDTPQKPQVERLFTGLRDLFSAVFFVAIGMQINLSVMGEVWWLILILAAFTVVVRAAASSVAQMAVGHPPREALQTGLCVTPIGEFSFIIAQMGVAAAVLPESFFTIAVGVSTLTAFVSPLLIQRAETFSGAVVARTPRRWLDAVDFYDRSLERLQATPEGSRLWRASRGGLVQLALTALVATGLLVFSGELYHQLEARRSDGLMSREGLRILYWTVLGLLTAVPVIAVWRQAGALALLFADGLTDGLKGKAWLRPLFERAFLFIAAACMALWLLSVIPFRDLDLYVLIVAGLLILLVVALSYRRLVRLQSRMEEVVRSRLAEEGGEPVAAPSPFPRLDLGEHKKWNLELDDILVADDAQVAGRTLADLGLRQRTGAGIIGVQRGGRFVANPQGDFTIFPGDRLLLVGTPEQRTQARDVLLASGQAAPATNIADMELDRMMVPDHSPHVGQRLGELGITAAFGVQLIGIRRGAERLPNPDGSVTIEAGDVLLVVGTEEQIHRFEAWLCPATE